MDVKITKALKQALDEDNLSSQLFMDLFREWKQTGEFNSYGFGKDSAYFKPCVGGKQYVLRHVHLVPIFDKTQLSKWNKGWQFKSRKTSNRVLIYVDDGKSRFLLIYILSEPDAHDVALMRTQKHKELMEGFAKVAEAFVLDGSIIA